MKDIEGPQGILPLRYEGGGMGRAVWCDMVPAERVVGTGLKLFQYAAEEISQLGTGNGKWFSFLLATVLAEHRK